MSDYSFYRFPWPCLKSIIESSLTTNLLVSRRFRSLYMLNQELINFLGQCLSKRWICMRILIWVCLSARYFESNNCALLLIATSLEPQHLLYDMRKRVFQSSNHGREFSWWRRLSSCFQFWQLLIIYLKTEALHSLNRLFERSLPL